MFSGCSDPPTRPSAVSSVVSGPISGQFALPTTTSRLTACVFAQPSSFHTNLTCVIRESCVSVTDVQLTLKMSMIESAGGAISGTSEITGTDTLGLCSPRPSQVMPVSLTVPVTGSQANITFGGSSTVAGLLSGQSADFNRAIAFTGTLRDGIVAGTVTYGEDFATQFGTINGSGSGSFQATLRVRAVPR
jgi:hypothetical protein